VIKPPLQWLFRSGCVLSLGWPLLAQSQPLPTVNQNPLLQSFGLPAAASSQPLATGKWALQLRLDQSNTLNLESKTDEKLLIDSENSLQSLHIEYGLNSEWNLSANLAYLNVNAGQLDTFIDDFHNLFGFPQGARPFYPNHQLHLMYEKEGIEQFNISQPQSGLLALRLGATVQLPSQPQQQSNLRFTLQLPNQKTSLLTASSTLSAQWNQHNRWLERWSSDHSLALLWHQPNGLLTEQQNRWLLLWSLGLSYRHSSLLEYTLQLDGHSAPFKQTQLIFLGSSVQLAIGGTLHFTPKRGLNIAVVEDIQVGASPDVNFHLSWHQQW